VLWIENTYQHKIIWNSVIV